VTARALNALNVKYHAAMATIAELRAENAALRARIAEQERLWEECRGLVALAGAVIDNHRKEAP